MPVVLKSVSPLGSLLATKIKAFMTINATAEMASKKSTPEDGAEAISHAIAYGISQAFQDPTVVASFNAGISLPTGGPVGSLIITPIQGATVEPPVPSVPVLV